MTSMFQELSAPFPPEAISWRAQTLTADGTKAMALAYIDARDVMRRLDEVCGPENWQDSYAETPKGRLIGTIEIRTELGWVSKSDGAGDTDVEGEKGAISDSFKRTAVKWGIGRYLYDTPTVWAPCETYERNGKKVWKAWKPEAERLFAAALKGAFTDTPKITESQRGELQQLFDHLNVPVADFLKAGKITDLRELQADRFDGARQWINQRAIEQRDQKKAA